MKFISIFLAALFPLAAFCLGHAPKTATPADCLPGEYLPLLQGKRVALVVNSSSVVDGRNLADFLPSKQVNVVKIFVPEHGFRGTADAGAKIESTIDSASGLPVLSLYGSHKKPKPEELEDVDVLVYDLQDVGVRFYTYISTMQYCMEACAENKKTFVVLDRPNPNGFYVDGPILDTANRSFVGMQPVPIVYGMTCGEYAAMLKGEAAFAHAASLELKVVQCKGYVHNMKIDLPTPPSPNLRSAAAIHSYPYLCLFEGTPVSVGRGTDHPFEQYGCPDFEGKYPHAFTPRTGAIAKSPLYEGKACFGRETGTDAEILAQLDHGGLNLEPLIDAYRNYPDKGKFFSTFFKKLAGTTSLEEQIAAGMTAEAIKATWSHGLEGFKKVREKYLLYP